MRSLRKIGRIIWPAVIWLALPGCSSHTVTLIHPLTGATAECSASGAGLGTGWAQGFVDSCVARYKNMGYLPSDDLTPDQQAALQKKGALPAN
jgi:hypothetical protein